MKLVQRLFLSVSLMIMLGNRFLGQDDVAQRVYRSAENSVFLVYLNDVSGTPAARGTAFLVAPRLLITNAHVADAGSPVLAVGPVRLPLKVVRIDEKNDLAILSVGADLTSEPLPLATRSVSPGQQIFAIGNPLGLEKTISQGIVAGLRDFEGRSLIQITSPISHGSSGGPILNSQGEVVGVAVETDERGQNLNFAVPVSFVKLILDEKSSASAKDPDLSSALQEADMLFKKRKGEEYSADPDSEYQKAGQRLLLLAKELSVQSNNPGALEDVACMGTKDVSVGDAGIVAARRLVEMRSSIHDRELLAYVLYERAAFAEFAASLSEDGSKEKAEAVQEHRKFLGDASQEALDVAGGGRSQRSLVAAFVLAQGEKEHMHYSSAVDLFSEVITGVPKPCGDDVARESYLSLIAATTDSKKPDEAERWFRRFAALYKPSAYEWDAEGDRRSAVADHKTAGEAYEMAASTANDYGFDYCYASAEKFYQTPTDGDGVLRNGRSCVDASVKDASEASQSHFKAELPLVYRYMADVLHSRGVEQPALEYAKESLALRPNEPFTLSIESEIFEGLQRYSECIAASRAAIAASDGKYPWMNFRLGSCYFDAENWGLAAENFTRAANADKTDAVSAFNAGLSFARQGFESDARLWFTEALARHPTQELRTQILNAMR